MNLNEIVKEMAEEAKSKEHAFLKGVGFAIGYFREDLAKIDPTHAEAYAQYHKLIQICTQDTKEASG